MRFSGVFSRLSAVLLLSLVASCWRSVGVFSSNNLGPTGATGGESPPEGSGGSPGAGGSPAAGGSSGGGGNGATGGNMGTGGNPPVNPDAGPRTVMPCPNSNAAVGVWENVTPSGVSLDPKFKTGAGENFGTNSFVIDPKDSRILYLGTSAMGIWKSLDCGANWTHINTGENGDNLDHGRQWTMVIDPVDPQVLYTVAGYGMNGVFKTTNGGKDWKQILPPDIAKAFIFGGFVARVRMDPTDHTHLLVSPHFSCEGSHAPTCLLETEDAGVTWRILDGTPNATEGSGIIMVDRKRWLWTQNFGGIFYTPDGGKSWQQVHKGNASDEMYIGPDKRFYVPGYFSVLVSTDLVVWNALMGAPASDSISGGPNVIYSSRGGCFGFDKPYQPFAYAMSDNPTKWMPLPSPDMSHAGGLTYDPDHKILYSTECLGGFWRVLLNK